MFTCVYLFQSMQTLTNAHNRADEGRLYFLSCVSFLCLCVCFSLPLKENVTCLRSVPSTRSPHTHTHTHTHLILQNSIQHGCLCVVSAVLTSADSLTSFNHSSVNAERSLSTVMSAMISATCKHVFQHY